MHFPLLCSIWTNSMTPDLPLSLSFFWSEGVPSLLITVISVLTGIILCKLNSKELCKSTRVIHVGAFSHNTDLGTVVSASGLSTVTGQGERTLITVIFVWLCVVPREWAGDLESYWGLEQYTSTHLHIDCCYWGNSVAQVILLGIITNKLKITLLHSICCLSWEHGIYYIGCLT